MLRITAETEGPLRVILKPGGMIVSARVYVSGECLRFLQEKRKALYDFSAVSFADEDAVKMLKTIASEK